jgi:NAD(P)-dependent dehydrogenase (short-subunit alcohol dehydrogenase family)
MSSYSVQSPTAGLPLAGKRGVVTGVGSGIGRALALFVAEMGGTVAGIDRDEESARRTSAEASALPGSVTAWQCDVTSESRIRDVFASLVSDGHTDFLVNAAGIEDSGDEITDMSADHWDHLMSINVRGPFLTMREVLPAMRANGRGSIVNIGSAGSLLGLGGLASYAASKHALAGLSKSAVAESARHGVRINVVCPGPIDTPLQDRAESKASDPVEFRRHQEAAIPQGRYGRPEEVASLVAFLLGDTAEYVNGSVIPIDGGLTATL